MDKVALAITHIEAGIKLLGEDLVTLMLKDQDSLSIPQYMLAQAVNSLSDATSILERVLV